MNIFVDMYSRVSFLFQILLWLFGYYVTIFVSIPHLVEKLSEKIVIEAILIFTQAFMFVCISRNIYYGSTVESYLTADQRNKLNEIEKKNSINYTNVEKIDTDSQVLELEDLKSLNNNIIKEEVSFCKRCDSIRHPRDRHCSLCGRCVVKFDHHCFILNNCIGKNNFKFFFSYIFLGLIQIIWFIIINFSSIIIYYLDYSSIFDKKLKENDNNEVKQFKIFGLTFDDLFFIIRHFPLRAVITAILSLICLIGLFIINIYNFNTIYFDETWTERKYKVKQSKEIEEKKKEIRKNNSMFKVFKDNLLLTFDTDTIFDVLWPENNN